MSFFSRFVYLHSIGLQCCTITAPYASKYANVSTFFTGSHPWLDPKIIKSLTTSSSAYPPHETCVFNAIRQITDANTILFSLNSKGDNTSCTNLPSTCILSEIDVDNYDIQHITQITVQDLESINPGFAATDGVLDYLLAWSKQIIQEKQLKQLKQQQLTQHEHFTQEQLTQQEQLQLQQPMGLSNIVILQATFWSTFAEADFCNINNIFVGDQVFIYKHRYIVLIDIINHLMYLLLFFFVCHTFGNDNKYILCYLDQKMVQQCTSYEP